MDNGRADTANPAMLQNYERVVSFHGHSCPGLAIGFRMTIAGLASLGNARSEDEEIIAVTENSACGVDALQVMSGCTFGKGNLFFLDFGKHSYTLASRKTGKAFRVTSVLSRDAGPGAHLDRSRRIDWILNAPEQEIVKVVEVSFELPGEAIIEKSHPCSICGEATMASRLEQIGGIAVCRGCKAD